MDWPALSLSLELALWTAAILMPVGVVVARLLAVSRFRGRGFVEALIALPLVLPPTVLGFFLLMALGRNAPVGRVFEDLTGSPLVFSFAGLVAASIVFNLPFAIQPLQRAFDAVPAQLREAAYVGGLSRLATFWRIELPLAWPGLLSGFVLTFAHTLGEFGVVLMVGGNIPGETRTLAVSIYDKVQAFDTAGATAMSLVLLVFSFLAIGLVYLFGERLVRVRA